METNSSFDLGAYYDDYPRIEEQFQSALDESLQPRGPSQLFDTVTAMGLPSGSTAVDVGCGEGNHALSLAATFGFTVIGIDPVRRHIELATEELHRTVGGDDLQRGAVRFAMGTAEALPVEDCSADLIWCRDVLVHASRPTVGLPGIPASTSTGRARVDLPDVCGRPAGTVGSSMAVRHHRCGAVER